MGGSAAGRNDDDREICPYVILIRHAIASAAESALPQSDNGGGFCASKSRRIGGAGERFLVATASDRAEEQLLHSLVLRLQRVHPISRVRVVSRQRHTRAEMRSAGMVS